MSLTITSYSPDAFEAVAFGRACQRALQLTHGAETDRRVEIITQPRKESGWLEYYINVFDSEDKRIIMVAMIQRTPDAEFEFHS